MKWIELTAEDQLQKIKQASSIKPIAIFKHSTRCSISSMAKARLERAHQPDHIDFYFLDLLAHRPVSDKIVEMFRVPHASPQVLLIKDGECVYKESHSGITMDELVLAGKN